jgi:hypothetical protein
VGSLLTPSTAVMRPLITAGPMLRASICPNVAELRDTGFWALAAEKTEKISRNAENERII